MFACCDLLVVASSFAGFQPSVKIDTNPGAGSRTRTADISAVQLVTVRVMPMMEAWLGLAGEEKGCGVVLAHGGRGRRGHLGHFRGA